MFILMGVGVVAGAWIMPGWFQIAALDYRAILLTAPLFLLTMPIDHYVFVGFHKLEKLKIKVVSKTKEFMKRDDVLG